MWSAISGLAKSYVECSVDFIEKRGSAEAVRLENVPCQLGRRLRPLRHLCNREITSDGVAGHGKMEKPQPWSLPPSTTEIHRVKRALWRLDIRAAICTSFTLFQRGLPTSILQILLKGRLYLMSTWKERGCFLRAFPGSELAELESILQFSLLSND